jgi:hypothetical protein
MMESEQKPETNAEITAPIIIDLGKQRNKRIKRLKKGRGKLWSEVADVLGEVRESLGEEADGKVLVPVVLVYRKKPGAGGNLSFPLFPTRR